MVRTFWQTSSLASCARSWLNLLTEVCVCWWNTSKMRVASVIKPLTEEPLSAEDTRRLVVDALKEGQRTKLENEWQLDFALQVDDVGRFRGNACYVSGAIEANFRRIPSEIGDLKSLGHSPVLDKWCDERAGMVLVT